ncbi:hypothetical protein TELCIR_13623 [Teladorsagia circumcincta]|uniref:Uncharacterized protein n=1 Tax=Teladorsagia circumcincta TaxID=45464 RepID=A0A2G9U384_TELCI|nr:hypothetical protein TELCIR_13623 [Teladorsagia circumcincta]
MATGEIIEINEEEKFWIPRKNITELTSGGQALLLNIFLPLLLKSYSNVCEVFKKDGPPAVFRTVDFEWCALTISRERRPFFTSSPRA